MLVFSCSKSLPQLNLYSWENFKRGQSSHLTVSLVIDVGCLILYTNFYKTVVSDARRTLSLSLFCAFFEAFSLCSLQLIRGGGGGGGGGGYTDIISRTHTKKFKAKSNGQTSIVVLKWPKESAMNSSVKKTRE